MVNPRDVEIAVLSGSLSVHHYCGEGMFVRGSGCDRSDVEMVYCLCVFSCDRSDVEMVYCLCVQV